MVKVIPSDRWIKFKHFIQKDYYIQKFKLQSPEKILELDYLLKDKY